MKVYRITNILNNRNYITYSSKENVNIFLFRSNKEFISDVNNYGVENFKIEIISQCSNKNHAFKIIKQNIKDNDYNISKKGLVVVKDNFGNNYCVKNTDPRFLNGELIAITKGKIVVKDKIGNKFSVDKNDSRFLNGELTHISTGIKQNRTKTIHKNIKLRTEKFKDLNKEIFLCYENNKRTFFIKDFCEHGDLTITPNILIKLYNLKYKTKIFYCEKCLDEFLKNYNPAVEEIEKNIDIYKNNIICEKNFYSSTFFVEESLKRYYPDIYKSILLYSNHYKNIDWSECVYMFRNRIKFKPKCSFKDCAKEAYYLPTSKRYTYFCENHSNNYVTSEKEKEIVEFVKLCYNNDIIENFKNLKKELDIYIPEKNLAIEFNGIYWHSEEYRDKNYHYDKYKLCQDNGIKLLTIWEDDWNNKKDIVKSIVLNALNKTPSKIYARKCKINTINYTEAKSFLEINHIQGNCSSSIRLGLYYNDELVSLMTFGKKRNITNQKSNKNEYELLRFCSKLNTNVVGGASKLFKYFTDNYLPNQVISYASCDISLGNLYERLNFKNIGHIGINYWWAKDKRYHRSNFMKHKLIKKGADSNKTESEIMREKGFVKIWGSGNNKWVWTSQTKE